jgi:hypothetical protein
MPTERAAGAKPLMSALILTVSERCSTDASPVPERYHLLARHQSRLSRAAATNSPRTTPSLLQLSKRDLIGNSNLPRLLDLLPKPLKLLILFSRTDVRALILSHIRNRIRSDTLGPSWTELIVQLSASIRSREQRFPKPKVGSSIRPGTASIFNMLRDFC